VAAAPEYSCSFCCRASEDLLDDVAFGDAVGEEVLLQADRQESKESKMIRTAEEFFMTSGL